MNEHPNQLLTGILSDHSTGDDGGVFEDPARFENRELSWLEFNRRVLEEVRNKNNPLLERVRFLSISASNLDEFFMVRVAGLMGQVTRGISRRSIDGLTAGEQLDKIQHVVRDLQHDQQQYWVDLQQELEAHGILIVSPNELLEREFEWLKQHFECELFPVLIPLSLDLAHPFPFISNLGHALALELERTEDGHTMTAFIRIPNALKRFVRIPGTDGKSEKFVLLEDAIHSFITMLYPGYKILSHGNFRVIRDSDLELEEEAEDLVLTFETALKKRRRGEVIRLETDSRMPDSIREFVLTEISADNLRTVMAGDFLALTSLSEIVDIDRPELKYPVHSPRFPERIRDHNGDCFRGHQAKRHTGSPPLRII